MEQASWQGLGLTSELMLSTLGFTRMMVSRISLWWQRVLWPEGEMKKFVLRRVDIVHGRRGKDSCSELSGA